MISSTFSALTSKPLFFSRSLTFSRQFQTPSSSSLPFNRSPPPFTQLRLRHSRLSSLSNDGSGGIGGLGGHGGFGGWDFDDNQSDDQKGIRSFFSCIAKMLDPIDETLASSVWWVFRCYCSVVGGQALLNNPAFLDLLAVLILAYFHFCILRGFSSFLEGIVFIYLGLFTLVGIIFIITLAYELTFRKGASEDDIRSLPMYRFSQSNVMVMVDDSKNQLVKARMDSYNQSHELSLHLDDSECSICLCSYVEGTELYRLPCTHHFHCGCISRWLRIKPTCPLCKYNIQRGHILV